MIYFLIKSFKYLISPHHSSLYLGSNLEIKRTKNKILILLDDDEVQSFHIDLPIKYFHQNIFVNIFRYDIKGFCFYGDEVLFNIGTNFYYIDHILNGRIQKISNPKGFKTLKIQYSEYRKAFFFGNYVTSNNSDTCIIKFENVSLLEEVSVPNIRHIHSMTIKGTSCYFSTGDKDHESHLFLYDLSSLKLKSIIGGSQVFRMVDFHIINNNVFYCTDAPSEQNYFVKLNLSSLKIDRLFKINSSSFFSVYLPEKNIIFFSTVNEPSAVNDLDSVWLYQFNIEDRSINKTRFKRIKLPLKIFQYPTISFPQISKEINNLSVDNLNYINTSKKLIV